MDIERTMFCAGLFAILFVYLAFQTALARTRESSVGEGTGDLLKKSRGVGNFAEHVPLMLILMMFLQIILQNLSQISFFPCFLLCDKNVN